MADKAVVIEKASLQALFEALKERKYEIIGPKIRNQAIVYDLLDTPSDLPAGWIDKQDGGIYSLLKQGEALFGYVVGPNSLKKFLYPPVHKLWEIRRESKSWTVTPTVEAPVKRAFIGVRSCELAALAIQDKIFMEDPFADVTYQKRRKQMFVIAVNCTRAGGTCFCVSMETGPKASSGFDLALTEIIDGDNHCFLVEAGSKTGRELLTALPIREATNKELEAASKGIERAENQMGRKIDTKGIKELLYRNFDNMHWEEIAKRCLSCSNCTLVCPTCFCGSVEDSASLSGSTAVRSRHWDSCFSCEFTYIHGGSIRATVMSRFRQWMTHKLGYWQDQFGSSGCVGCGRCITWCPVGIDITEEAASLRKKDLK